MTSESCQRVSNSGAVLFFSSSFHLQQPTQHFPSLQLAALSLDIAFITALQMTRFKLVERSASVTSHRWTRLAPRERKIVELYSSTQSGAGSVVFTLSIKLIYWPCADMLFGRKHFVCFCVAHNACGARLQQLRVRRATIDARNPHEAGHTIYDAF